MKPTPEDRSLEKGKEKIKPPGTESTPITRQGYRSGRLADDFWTVMAIPDTPLSPRKKLRIIPFLTKNFCHAEYLVDNSKTPYTTIATVHIAELLAGVPWTLPRAKLHIVNETAHALHKVLIFNNQHNTPFHKWEQGSWFSQWTMTAEGDHLCTCFVSVAVPESKIKVRKGRDFGWRKIPTIITDTLTATQTELIQAAADLGSHLQGMAGKKEKAPPRSNP
jgi:hypothetical protein